MVRHLRHLRLLAAAAEDDDVARTPRVREELDVLEAPVMGSGVGRQRRLGRVARSHRPSLHHGSSDDSILYNA